MDISTKTTGSQLTASEFMQAVTELEALIESAGIALAAGTLDQLKKSVSDYSAGGNFGTDSGIADAYVLSPIGSKEGQTSYADGLQCKFKVGATNTGASTVNVNGLGLKNILAIDDSVLLAGSLEINDLVTIIYDSGAGYFRLIDSKFLRSTLSPNKIPPNILLTSANFINVTDLYGWHNNGSADYDDGDWVGAKALTENGTGLSTSSNQLGLTAFCNFNGVDDFLSSIDAVFDGTDSFRCGGWIRPDDQTGEQSLISKYNTATTKRSFDLRLSTTSIDFEVWYGDNTSVTLSTVPSLEILDGNYHHVEGIYNQTDNSLSISVDGKVSGYVINANLAARQNSADADLNFGARANAATDQFYAGDLTEFYYQDLSDDTLAWINNSRKVYAAGSGKLCTEDINDVVRILDGRTYINDYMIFILATYNIETDGTSNLATGYQLPIVEDGYYELLIFFNGSHADPDSLTQSIYYKVHDGAADLEGSFGWTSLAADANAEEMRNVVYLTIAGYFIKGTVLSLYAASDNGDACALSYSDGVREPYMRLKQLN